MSNLKKAGLLHSPTRGIWDLTQLGKEVNLNEFDVWDDVYAISTPLWEEARAKKANQKIRSSGSQARDLQRSQNQVIRFSSYEKGPYLTIRAFFVRVVQP